MPYIEVPAEAVEERGAEDLYLEPGDYTGEANSFKAWASDEGVEKLRVGVTNIANGSGAIRGTKTWWIVSTNPSSEENTRIGRETIARLARAVGVLQYDDNGRAFVPGDTLEETAREFSLGVQSGTRIGFRVRNRNKLVHGVPQRDENDEPITYNEIKSVWKPRA